MRNIAEFDLLDYVPATELITKDCPKCGASGDIWGRRYQEFGKLGSQFMSVDHEFIKLICYVCGYTEGMKCKT